MGPLKKRLSIPREEGHFFPGEYVVCEIDKGYYIAGRLLRASGKNPPTLTICLYQGRQKCGEDESCESFCKKRVLTSGDNGGVLNIKDLFAVLDNPDPLDLIDPRHVIMDYARAEALFYLIDNLEKRQKGK